jgi:hypothetical protein
MNKVEIYEHERAMGYNQFVETRIPNYHYFMDKLPKLLSEVNHKERMAQLYKLAVVFRYTVAHFSQTGHYLQ